MSDELDKELTPQNDTEQNEEELESNEELDGKDESQDEKKPKSKKEDSKELDIEALKKALREEIMESVRVEEKSKLYPSLEKYKEDAKKAEEARKLAEEKLKEYETTKLTAEEQATLKLQQLEESNAKLQEQLDSIIENANTKINTLQLELEKKEILAQYGDEIISALVTGSTLEEIQKSAENAHREYISIREKELAKLKDNTKQKDKIGTGISPKNDRLNAGVTKADIDKINDPKVWEANREKYLQEALKRS